MGRTGQRESEASEAYLRPSDGFEFSPGRKEIPPELRDSIAFDDIERLALYLARDPSEAESHLAGNGALVRNVCDLIRQSNPLAHGIDRMLYTFALGVSSKQLLRSLFVARFDIKITSLPPHAILAAWEELMDLPDHHVRNLVIDRITKDTDHSRGGAWYESTGTIKARRPPKSNTSFFQDTCRHEVGHAVHAMLFTHVEQWLSNIGIEAREVSDETAQQVIDNLHQPGRDPDVNRHQLQRWLAEPTSAGKRLARKRFVGNISTLLADAGTYQNYYRFPQGKDGLYYFYNDYYRKIVTFSQQAMDIISSFDTEFKSSYIAYSKPEFFAELYEGYFGTAVEMRASIFSPQIVTFFEQDISPSRPELQEAKRRNRR